MAEPKWTSGPWTIWRSDDPDITSPSSHVAVVGNIYVVAQGEPRELGDANADAHLIAAAPDLYRELENLVELAEAAMRAANRDGGEYDIEAELADARAALRKARGGQQ